MNAIGSSLHSIRKAALFMDEYPLARLELSSVSTHSSNNTCTFEA